MGRRRKAAGDPKQAVAYLRVSTPEQSLDAQRDAITRWAAQQGVQVTAWIEDHGVSGAAPIDERPGLLQALAELRLRNAGLLVAAKRDRLARDVSAAAAIERLAGEGGARVVTADGLDPSDTPEGVLMRTLIDAIAQYERALIRARTKSALLAKSGRGEVVGAIPYGSRGEGGRLHPHAAEQAALARMRTLRAEGQTHRAIVAKLTAEGHAPRGERWHATTVSRSLKR